MLYLYQPRAGIPLPLVLNSIPGASLSLNFKLSNPTVVEAKAKVMGGRHLEGQYVCAGLSHTRL